MRSWYLVCMSFIQLRRPGEHLLPSVVLMWGLMHGVSPSTKYGSCYIHPMGSLMFASNPDPTDIRRAGHCTEVRSWVWRSEHAVQFPLTSSLQAQMSVRRPLPLGADICKDQLWNEDCSTLHSSRICFAFSTKAAAKFSLRNGLCIQELLQASDKQAGRLHALNSRGWSPRISPIEEMGLV